jgi:glutamate N-acetyltransferase/amino-acid N-acetyltransferase
MTTENLLKIEGFKGNGIHSKIKFKKLDLGLIFSDEPCTAAGVFTLNKACAAPVKISKENIKNPIKAIIINSGNANACTGTQGMADANQMCSELAKELNINPDEVLIASTGIIGKPLPMENISQGIQSIVKDISYDNFNLVPTAILTTDLDEKTCSNQVTIDDCNIKINGMAKGSGMIHPNMATTLAFVTTNVNIKKNILQDLLKEISDLTFNMISVDGDTSTNDSLIILSNNTAKNQLIDSKESPGYKLFKKALYDVIETLAIKVVKDGEGATKLITAHVSDSSSLEDAKKQAKSVITSNLVKAAFFGEDVNWGRILCALGYSETNFDSDKVTLKFKSSNQEILILDCGTPKTYDSKIAKEIMASDSIDIHISMKTGEYSAKAWGCDLSYDYIKINACYEDAN